MMGRRRAENQSSKIKKLGPDIVRVVVEPLLDRPIHISPQGDIYLHLVLAFILLKKSIDQLSLHKPWSILVFHPKKHRPIIVTASNSINTINHCLCN